MILTHQKKKQPFGSKSRDNLASYIAGEIVTVKYKSKDRYGRVLELYILII